jgi:hypothetical protein
MDDEGIDEVKKYLWERKLYFVVNLNLKKKVFFFIY